MAKAQQYEYHNNMIINAYIKRKDKQLTCIK